MRNLTLPQRAIRALFWIGNGYLLASGEAVTVAVCLGIGVVFGLIEIAARNKAKRRAADLIVEATGGNGRVGPRRPTTFKVNTPRGAQVISGTVVHGDVSQVRGDR